MTPIEKICQYKSLLMSWKHDQYIPQARRLDVQDIANAMHEINPNYILRGGCSGCVNELLDLAYKMMMQHEANKPQPTFHTFPAVEQKKRGRKPKA